MVTIPHWLIRYGFPTAFLLVATASILVVRAGLHDDVAAPAVRPAPPAPSVSLQRPGVRSARASAYSVRRGDTLGTIAERFGTTVDQLLALNPGIDPRGLRVGQPLRVQ
jgi:hypothetical protein